MIVHVMPSAFRQKSQYYFEPSLPIFFSCTKLNILLSLTGLWHHVTWYICEYWGLLGCDMLLLPFWRSFRLVYWGSAHWPCCPWRWRQ